MQDDIHFLIYISRAVKKLEKIELIDLCAKAAAKNTKLNISGLLLCVGNTFLQILEGERDIVRTLYKEISLDPRHTQCRLLLENTTRNRVFGQWSMNFLQMDDEYFLKFEEFTELRNYIDKIMKFPEQYSDKIIKLIQRIPKILKAHKVELDILSPITLERGKPFK